LHSLDVHNSTFFNTEYVPLLGMFLQVHDFVSWLQHPIQEDDQRYPYDDSSKSYMHHDWWNPQSYSPTLQGTVTKGTFCRSCLWKIMRQHFTKCDIVQCKTGH
jgi:hypothetical protein